MKKYIDNSSYNDCDIVRQVCEAVVDRLNSEDDLDLDETINEELDTALIYYDDQWEMMKYYQTPKEADWDAAVEECLNDIYANIEEVDEDDEEDEDVDEIELDEDDEKEIDELLEDFEEEE